MKLINFYKDEELNSLRKKMHAELIEWNPVNQWNPTDDSKLHELIKKREIQVNISEIDIGKDGSFEFNGQKVIVYIKQQNNKRPEQKYKALLIKYT